MTILLLLAALASSPQDEDRTAVALERCLASPKAAPLTQPDTEADPDVAAEAPSQDGATPEAGASSGPDRSDGRGLCLDNARRSYDARIVKAYRTLLRRLDTEQATTFSQANQAWLDYRAAATSDLDVVAAARDHALWLEGLLRR